MKTRIKGRWVVGYDGTDHVLIEGGEVVFEGDSILYVGKHYDGAVDRTIDASGQLISPGWVNFHAVSNVDLQVLMIDAKAKGLPKSREYLFDPTEPYVLDEAETRAGVRHAILQFLKCGCTTFGSINTQATKRFGDPPYEPVLLVESAGEMGARGYFAHQFWSRSYYLEGGQRHDVFNEEKGFEGLERAVEFSREYEGRFHDRVRTYMFPYTLDKCSPDLLRQAARRSRDLGVPLRTHFAQYPFEVQEVWEQHGLSPVEYLDSLEFLAPNTTLTHAIYIAGKNGTPYPDGRELDLLVERGTSVCHCPTVFVRSGEYLSSFERYLRHGVNLAIGTDTFPQDMIEEMRLASYLGKVADASRGASSSADIFRAATLGGARAFGRDDLGRLAPGAKADLITIDFEKPHLMPIDDPIKGVVNYAHGTDVDTVIVNGEIVVQGGACCTADEQEILRGAQAAYDKMTDTFVSWDEQGRSRDELFPFAFRKQS